MFRERVAALLAGDLIRIVLFGSRARGEGHEESDLDLLVLVRTFESGMRRRVLDIAADIDDETGLRLAPVVMDQQRFDRSSPLHDAVVRDGVPL
jgi:predicted nucleotidyltransferase